SPLSYGRHGDLPRPPPPCRRSVPAWRRLHPRHRRAVRRRPRLAQPLARAPTRDRLPRAPPPCRWEPSPRHARGRGPPPGVARRRPLRAPARARRPAGRGGAAGRVPADGGAGAGSDAADAQKKSMRAEQRLRDDVVAERATFAEWQQSVDGSRVVCVDESGVLAGMRTAYGYAPMGERCVEHAPYRKGRRTSLIGWVRGSGAGEPGGCGKVVGVEGSVDGALFAVFVRDHLAPYLRPGDVVVWDNH